MPFPDYDPLDEGEALTAASLNTRINTLQNSVNDLPPDALKANSLRKEHLSAIAVSTVTPPNTNFVPGFTKANPAPTVFIGPFTNLFTGATRTVFLGDGPSLGGNGWAAIASAVGTNVMEILFTNNNLEIMPTTGDITDTNMCTGLLIKANVAVITTSEIQMTDQNLAGDYVPTAAFATTGMGIALFWTDDLGATHLIQSSEAFAGRAQIDVGDIATSALLTNADTEAVGAGRTVQNVFCAIANFSATSSTSSSHLYIREWRISALPILGGSL
tara:strand:- start:1689 stop:2507 length:819 start_codon:yes stop_codon:yes gene_type:complete